MPAGTGRRSVLLVVAGLVVIGLIAGAARFLDRGSPSAGHRGSGGTPVPSAIPTPGAPGSSKAPGGRSTTRAGPKTGAPPAHRPTGPPDGGPPDAGRADAGRVEAAVTAKGFSCARTRGEVDALVVCATTEPGPLPTLRQVVIRTHAGRLTRLDAELEGDPQWLGLTSGAGGSRPPRSDINLMPDQATLFRLVISAALPGGAGEVDGALMELTSRDGGTKRVRTSGYEVVLRMAAHRGRLRLGDGSAAKAGAIPSALERLSPDRVLRIATSDGFRCSPARSVLRCRAGKVTLSATVDRSGAPRGGPAVRALQVRAPATGEGRPAPGMAALARDLAELVGGRLGDGVAARSAVGACFGSSTRVVPAAGARMVCSPRLDGTDRQVAIRAYRFAVTGAAG